MFRIGDTIINTAHVARVTKDNLSADNQVTVWYVGGQIQMETFFDEQADAVWKYFNTGIANLNELIALNQRQAARIEQADREGVPA